MNSEAIEQFRREVKSQESIEQLAWLMDDLFRIPVLGWRFGLDALIGLIPGLGDTVSSLASFYILASAVRYGVPKITLLRMGVNIALDYLFGSLPIAGDLFDAWWKSNQRNIALLRDRGGLGQRAATEGDLSDWVFVGGILLVLVAMAVGAALLSFYFIWLITDRLFFGRS